MAEKTVATASDTSPVTAEETRTRDRHISPAVDIYETAEGLVLMADLPGVAEEDLEVRSDNNILTIWGASRPAVEGEVISREYELVNFFRRFEVGEKIDQSMITAEFKHGVLTLNLPKAEAVKARRIDVKVA
jgi:HSP20 family molecular chaperone IbpA